MENKAAHQDEGGASSSAGSSAELSRVLREIELVKSKIIENWERDQPMEDEEGLSEYGKRCKELKYLQSVLEEINEKTWEKETTRDAEGPSTSRAPSDEQMEELQEAKDKLDRKRGLEDEGTSTDPSGESAKRPRSSQETNSGELQLLDGEDFTALHLAIEKGDLETVKRVVENHEGELRFSHDDTSALYTAFQSAYLTIAILLDSNQSGLFLQRPLLFRVEMFVYEEPF